VSPAATMELKPMVTTPTAGRRLTGIFGDENGWQHALAARFPSRAQNDGRLP
jgi:hypothetical protein